MRTIGVPGHLFPAAVDRVSISAGHIGRQPDQGELARTLRAVFGITVQDGRWCYRGAPVRVVVVDELLFAGERAA